MADRYLEIIKGEKKEIYDEEAVEFTKGRYIFRYPFANTALKWGFCLSSLFAANRYYKTSN